MSVDTTLAVRKLITESGGTLSWSKVGEANVVKLMLQEGCAFGGEGSSGGLIVGDFNLCRDGTLASILVATVIQRYGSLGKALAGVPRTRLIRTKIPSERKISPEELEGLAGDAWRIERLDGVKIWASEDSWVLIRPSNTEPAVRLSVEAPTEEEAQDLASRYLERLRPVTRASREP